MEIFCFSIAVFLADHDGKNYGARFDNGTFTGAINSLVNRKIDFAAVAFFIKDYETRDFEFTTSIFQDSLCAVVKPPAQIPPSLMPLIIFHPDIWICLAVSFVLCFCFLSFLKFSREFGRKDDRDRFYFRTAVLNMASHAARSNLFFQYAQIFIDTSILMAGAPFRRFSKSSSDRFIFASLSVISLNFVSVFQSGLSTAYTKPSFFQSIDTLKQLDESGMNIIIKYPAMMQDLFPPDSSPLFKSLNHKMKLIEKYLSTSNITYDLQSIGITRKENFKLSREAVVGDNYLVPECPKIYNLAYAVPAKSVFLQRINTVLLDIHCHGFFHKWFDEFSFKITLENTQLFKIKPRGGVKILTAEDLELSIIILCGGLVLSAMVFVSEILWRRTIVLF